MPTTSREQSSRPKRSRATDPAPSDVVALLESLPGTLKAWRMASPGRLTQEQVAEKAGVSRGLIAQIETGRTGVTLELLARLAHVYGVTVEAMLRPPGASPRPKVQEAAGLVEQLSDEQLDHLLSLVRSLRLTSTA